MNYSTLNNLLPSYFRPIGYWVSFSALSFGFFLKLVMLYDVSHFSLVFVQLIFFIGLLLVVSTKTKTEDERIVAIRQQIWNHGYWLILGYLIAMILLSELRNSSPETIVTLSLLCSIATMQALVFEISLNFDVLEWMGKNKSLYYLILVISLISLIIFNFWFWHA